MLIKRMMLLMALLVFVGSASFAQHKYVGVKKCKMCHNKPTTGKQYEKWSKAGHFGSFKALSSEKAKEYAKKHGIEDPTTEAGCVKCHTTAGSVDKSLHAGITPQEGVSCESCHGPGSKYKSSTIMKSQKESLANGMIIPNEETCKKCHAGENPYHDMKPFDYAASSAKIAHPNPAKK